MGNGEKAPLRLQFNPKVRLEFHGATVTSDAGLLPIRELDDALGLTHIYADYIVVPGESHRRGVDVLSDDGYRVISQEGRPAGDHLV